MFKNLLIFDELYEACEQNFTLGDATMLRNFGPLAQEEKIHLINFDLESGVVTTYDEANNEIHKFEFQLMFKPTE